MTMNETYIYFTPSTHRIRHVEVKAINMPRTMEIIVRYDDESVRDRTVLNVDDDDDDDDVS
jgi:hypothetical protein